MSLACGWGDQMWLECVTQTTNGHYEHTLKCGHPGLVRSIQEQANVAQIATHDFTDGWSEFQGYSQLQTHT